MQSSCLPSGTLDSYTLSFAPTSFSLKAFCSFPTHKLSQNINKYFCAFNGLTTISQHTDTNSCTHLESPRGLESHLVFGQGDIQCQPQHQGKISTQQQQKKHLVTKKTNDSLLFLGNPFCYSSRHKAQKRTLDYFHTEKVSHFVSCTWSITESDLHTTHVCSKEGLCRKLIWIDSGRRQKSY